MSYERVLPWRRKSTMADGSGMTLAATTNDHLWGKVIKTVDSSDRPQKLRIVHLEAEVTAAKKVLAFDDDEADLGRQVSGIAGVAGVKGKPLDDQQVASATLAANDCVYVIEEGYCDCLSGAAYDAGADLMTDNAGKLVTATAGNAIIAHAEEAATDADQTKAVYVYGGIPKTVPT